METPYLPIYPYYGHVPFLFYQPWSHPATPLPSVVTVPANEVETRETLISVPTTQQVPTPTPTAALGKPTKSKRLIVKEKLLRRREREDNYERKKQKKDRNMPSNILKNLSNFIYLNPNILDHLARLIPATLHVSPKELVQKFKQTIKFGQSYIRPFLIQSLCKEGTFTREEALVFRIMLRRFLLLDMPLLIMTQTKLKRKQRYQYIKMGRKLLGQLRDCVFQ